MTADSAPVPAPQPPPAAVPAPSTAPRARRTKEERRKLLGDTTHKAVRVILDKTVSVVFKDDEVEGGSGDPRVVNDFMTEVVRLAEATAEAFRIRRVEFGRSVEFVLEPVVPESVRDEVDRLAVAAPDQEISEEEFDRLVPRSIVAAVRLAEIITLPPEEAFEVALAYRPAVAVAYTELSKTLKDHGASVLIEIPDVDSGSLDAATAAEAVALAEEPESAEPITITVRGLLSAADSTKATFKVMIDDDVRPPELAPQARSVEGPYNSASRRAVEKDNLWNKTVVAEVLVIREKHRDRRNPTNAGYSFQSIRKFSA